MLSDSRNLEALEDPETWDPESAELRPGVAHARAVVAVPFAQPEFQRLAAAARERGLSTIDFIREAALAHLNAEMSQR